MTKINFQNLPSTTTPISATNLNQLQTNVENEFKRSILYETDLVNPSPFISVLAATWTNLKSSDWNVSLPKGKYLFVIGTSITSSAGSTGMCILRPLIGGTEEVASERNTVPITSGYTSGIQTLKIINQAQTGSVSLNAQVFCTVACSITQTYMRVIELSKEV